MSQGRGFGPQLNWAAALCGPNRGRLTDALGLAEEELRQRSLPLCARRIRPDGSARDWPLHELLQPGDEDAAPPSAPAHERAAAAERYFLAFAAPAATLPNPPAAPSRLAA